MDDYTQQIRSLLTLADQMPSSTARLETYEEAVRVADTHQDITLGIEARQPLMAEARNLLRGDVLATAFVWSLAQFDREPEQFGERDLLTEYRWVIGQLANLHTIPRVKLEELLADFSRRLSVAGLEQRDFYLTQRAIAPDLGDRDLALGAIRSMREPSGVRTWDLTDQIITELFVGNEEKALQLGGLLSEGNAPKGYLPDDACAYLLLPLLKRGRSVEATALLKQSFRSYQPQRCYYWWYGEMLKFLVLTNDHTRAIKMYAECQQAIKEFTDPLTRLHFALDAIVLFDRLVAIGTEEVSSRLPESVPVPHNRNRYSVAALCEWVKGEAIELADLFDARNGTSYFREELAERAELQRLAIENK